MSVILPPSAPLSNTPHKTYFNFLCATVQQYLNNISIDFTGYDELVQAYMEVRNFETDKNFELSKSFNAWYEYISDITNIIQNQFLDAETNKLQVVSEKSILANEKSVSAGDRKANTDPEVIVARKRRNALKSFYDVLIARQNFCEKAFYQCKHCCIDFERDQRDRQ